MPGQPRAKGGVEVAQNVVEQHFESLLRVQPVNSAEELNRAAFAWCNAYNANLIADIDCRLNRAGLAKPIARNDLWLLIKAEALRLCPITAVCAAFMRGASATRVVTNRLDISYRHPASTRSHTYDLRGIREIRTGMEVTVRPLIYGEESVIVGVERYDGERIETRIDPVRNYDAFGFRDDSPSIGESYHALPTLDATHTSDRLDHAAYGIDADGVIRSDEEIAKLKASGKATPFAHLNDGNGIRPLDKLLGIETPIYLPKKGVPVVPKTIALTPVGSTFGEDNGLSINVAATMHVGRGDVLSVYQIAKRLRGDLDDWDAGKYSQLAEKWPEGAFDDEYAGILQWFQGRGRMQVVR